MVYLTKEEAEKLIKKLSKSKNKQIGDIIKKLKSSEKRRIYVTSRTDINRLLGKAFKEKRKVKIKYYSPHNDKSTIRVVDIYKIYNGVVAGFCHLRKYERNFVIDRINSVAMLDEKYSIPKGWTPESIILNK